MCRLPFVVYLKSRNSKNIQELLYKMFDIFSLENYQGYDPNTGILTLKNNDQYQAGKFRTPTVDELEEQIKKIPPPSSDKNNKMNIFVVENNIDVGKQHLCANDDDIFQVASQFNALEMIDSSKTPNDGISIYQFDKTQGPTCALACLPGTFVRNYYYNMPVQFNALDCTGLGKYFKNGYLLIPVDKTEEAYHTLAAEYKKIKIPMMLDTQVMGKIGGKYVETKTLVNQVFNSSLPIGVYDNGSDVYMHDISNIFLKIAYYSILVLAVLKYKETNRRVKVNLTLIGVGAFNNNIHSCINRLCEIMIKFKDYPLDVYINSYWQHDLVELNINRFNLKCKMKTESDMGLEL